MKNKKILILISVCSMNFVNAKVYLYQQWHLLAKTKTLDIEKSKKLKQFKNQKFIYDHIDNLIKEKKIKTVFSEGCEGEINSSFSLNFNGWDYQKLIKQKKNYENIMTLIPLKLEAKYKDNLATYCGDDMNLVDKHGLAFSDVRGYYGYFLRFKQFKNKPVKTKLYVKALEETEKKKIKDPIEFTRNKAKNRIADAKRFIALRNDKFIEQIKKYGKSQSAVVLGALHMDDLTKKLKKEKIEFEVVSVEGLPRETKGMFERLEFGLR